MATAESGAYAHSPHARSQPKSVKKHSRTVSTKEVKPNDSKPSKEPLSPAGHVKDTSKMKAGDSKDHGKALAAAATIDEFELMSVLGILPPIPAPCQYSVFCLPSQHRLSCRDRLTGCVLQGLASSDV